MLKHIGFAFLKQRKRKTKNGVYTRKSLEFTVQ